MHIVINSLFTFSIILIRKSNIPSGLQINIKSDVKYPLTYKDPLHQSQMDLCEERVWFSQYT